MPDDVTKFSFAFKYPLKTIQKNTAKIQLQKELGPINTQLSEDTTSSINRQKLITEKKEEKIKEKNLNIELQELKKQLPPMQQQRSSLQIKIKKTQSDLNKFNNKKKFLKITIKSEENKNIITEILEIYGIEDPYPKLYINDNNMKNSTQACSYVHSKENIINEHLPSKIYKIKKEDDKFDETQKNEFDKIEKIAGEEQKRRAGLSEALKKLNCQDASKNIVCEIIKGNMYENTYDNGLSNKMYNFCSNNIKHYENKLYSYDYDKDRYYYQEKIDYETNVYDEKQRVKLGKLSKEELEMVQNIKKLKSPGVDLISVNINTKLTNPNGRNSENQIDNYFKMFSQKAQEFIIRWEETSAFKSSVLINLIAKHHSGGTEKHIKNIKIVEDPLENKNMAKHLSNIKNNFKNKIENEIKKIKKTRPFFKLVDFNEKDDSPCNDYDTIEKEWDDPPPEKCCHDEDKCEIKKLYEIEEVDCIKIDRDNVEQRLIETNNKILKKINDLIVSYLKDTTYSSNDMDLEKWTNLLKFIDNNFTKFEILNSKQTKLIGAYNLILTKRINIIKKQKENVEGNENIGNPASFLKTRVQKILSFGGGGGTSKKI